MIHSWIVIVFKNRRSSMNIVHNKRFNNKWILGLSLFGCDVINCKVRKCTLYNCTVDRSSSINKSVCYASKIDCPITL